MNASQFLSKLTELGNEDDVLHLYKSKMQAVTSCNNIQDHHNNIIYSPSTTGVQGTTTQPYIGDPIGGCAPYFGDPINVWPTTTDNTGGTWVPSVLNPSVYGPSALDAFLDIQFLTVEARCAVTGRMIKKGEPVLILLEHIISKEAFRKMLCNQFEGMMFKMEEMDEVEGYDS